MTPVLLNGLVALPAAFAVLVALLGARRPGAGVATAAVGGLLVLAWSVLLVMRVPGELAGGPGGPGDPGGTVDLVWVAALDIHWHLGVDGISGPLVLMTTLVFGCVLVALLRRPPVAADPDAPASPAALAALLLLIEAGVLGSFLALDMVLFFAFFEVALIPMWFVIQQWGDGADPARRRRAATRFLVFTVLGSAVMLVGFVLVRAETGSFDIVEVAATYAAQGGPSGTTAVTASVLVGLGLAVKTPVWPLHIWLPDAHATAPTVGSVVLAAVLLKLGTYGLVRFWLPVTDPSWELVAPLAAGFATVGIVYAALACLAQSDLKRLIAYSSVGHMGFVVLALATFTTSGVQAAVLASVAHGLITGLLFFTAGAVKDRYGTGDLGRLHGLYGQVPRLGAVVAFGAMASLGLPGLAGFWGEMLAIRAAVFPADALPRATFVVLAGVAALGVVLTAVYFLALMRSMLQPGPGVAAPASLDAGGSGATGTGAAAAVATAGPESAAAPADVRPLEWLVWAPLMALTLLLGVAPGLVLSPVASGVAGFLGAP